MIKVLLLGLVLCAVVLIVGLVIVALVAKKALHTRNFKGLYNQFAYRFKGSKHHYPSRNQYYQSHDYNHYRPKHKKKHYYGHRHGHDDDYDDDYDDD